MKKVLSIIFAFCMLFVSVYAEDSFSCDYSTDEHRITVSAQFEGLGAHIFAIICAKLPLNIENITLDTMLENEDEIVYYNHVATDILGNASEFFTLSETAENGIYTILITDGINSKNTTFFRFDEEVAEEALRELNSITNYEDFKTELFNMLYAGELPVAPNQHGLSDELKEKVASYLFNNKSSNCEEFKSNFDSVSVVGRIELASRDEIISIISENAEKLDVDTSILDKFTVKQKIFFLDKMEIETYGSLEDFAEKYVDAIVLSISSEPGNYSDVKEIIEKFPECGITFGSDYNKLKDKAAVFKLLVKKGPFNTIDELQNAIDVATKERLKTEKSGLAGLAGGSSSSEKPVGSVGGGGGSAVVNPPATIQKVEFSDLQDVLWAKDAICNLRDKGVISGYDNNTFAPNKSVSRFEFIKMLVCAFELQLNVDTIPFADIPDDHWCKNYVASAYKLGIIKGVTNEEFGGDNLIKREDMSVMMCRLAELIGVNMKRDENISVSDIDTVSVYAKESVEKCVGTGLMIGNNGKFSPEDETTRAQCAVVIDRFTEMAGEVK